jgi:hypothetical protein
MGWMGELGGVRGESSIARFGALGWWPVRPAEKSPGGTSTRNHHGGEPAQGCADKKDVFKRARVAPRHSSLPDSNRDPFLTIALGLKIRGLRENKMA